LCREQSLLSISQARYVPPYSMAIVHLGLGQRDVPLNFLPIDPKWDWLGSDRRFCSLLRELWLFQPGEAHASTYVFPVF
jgi:hypothetical protein